jgi:hypothetical protein
MKTVTNLMEIDTSPHNQNNVFISSVLEEANGMRLRYFEVSVQGLL